MSNNKKRSVNIFRLGVLICDHVNETLQAEFDDYPKMFNELFDLVTGDLVKDDWVKDNFIFELKFFNIVDNEFPESINDCDAYITSGSKSSANDNDDWIRTLEDFIRELYRENKRFVGICFGHQLLAKALGGSVGKSDRGWGIGIHTSKVNSDFVDDLELKELNLIVSHQDQINELPKDAKVLYSSEFCPYSMIKVGENFIGMQGHPEFSRSYSSALMEMRKEIIPAKTIAIGQESLNCNTDSQVVAQWLVDFLMRK